MQCSDVRAREPRRLPDAPIIHRAAVPPEPAEGGLWQRRPPCVYGASPFPLPGAKTMRSTLAILLLPLLLSASLAAPAAAQNPAPAPNAVRVELASGEIIIGVLISSDG